MLKKFNEDDMHNLAKITSKQSRQINLLYANNYNSVSALKVIEYKLRISGFSFRIDKHDDEYIYTVEHNLGYKWSLYLSDLFAMEFNEVNCEAVFEIADDMIAFKVKP